MIREFSTEDFQAVIELFQFNTPTYFHPDEQHDLEQYLQNEREDYYVFLAGEKIVGAGGINYLPKEKTAILSWDLIHPNHQRQGIGTKLVKHRLQRIKELTLFPRCIVRTSQLVYPFYQNLGFNLISKHPNYWADGYDMYFMETTF
ncbi:GNAT family N-acetyltransferase [Lishizhenia sp.]|uniref:GNAT family N-acetyltransferase n=1 Tax=Lishizhenia sp. TaxID=2497594 RepID=UPI00299D9E01|nr:GNAT family N-acetyltransferase [Lishizhenia sp.]MDX1447228.1 GNAT family N-acetyltransferase [Lishizhenia sp.]